SLPTPLAASLTQAVTTGPLCHLLPFVTTSTPASKSYSLRSSWKGDPFKTWMSSCHPSENPLWLPATQHPNENRHVLLDPQPLLPAAATDGTSLHPLPHSPT
ncbi:hypothetical protein H1C71_007573, partial [Ictidomys tridecemlineatus]